MAAVHVFNPGPTPVLVGEGQVVPSGGHADVDGKDAIARQAIAAERLIPTASPARTGKDVPTSPEGA